MSDEGDVRVIPTEELRAMLTVLLAKDRIQEPLAVIMSDDAEDYLVTKNFLEIMGLRSGDFIYDSILETKMKAALNRAIQNEDLYLRLQMIATKEGELEYHKIDGGGAVSIEREGALRAGDAAGT